MIRARRRNQDLGRHAVSKPFTVGGEGSGSDPDIYALLLKNVFGVKLRLISGYPGTTEMALARRARRGRRPRELVMDQPEVAEAGLDRAEEDRPFRCSSTCTRSPDLQDVPLIGDFAKTERQRQIMKLVISRQDMGRPFMAPPGLPADRAAALRTAFDETMKDPEFIDEATARGQEVNPVSGADARQADRGALRDAEGRGGGNEEGDRRAVARPLLCLGLLQHPGGAVGISSAAWRFAARR